MGDGFRYLIDGFWVGNSEATDFGYGALYFCSLVFSHDKFVYGLQHLGVDGYSNVVVRSVSHNISCIPLVCCFCPHCVPYVLGFKTIIILIDNINDIDFPSLSIDAAQHSIYGGQYYSVFVVSQAHSLHFFYYILACTPLIYYSVFVNQTNS